MEKLTHYLEQKGVAITDRLCHLSTIFSTNKEVNLWWQRTKLQISSWEEFTFHFLSTYGTPEDHHAALEKLYRRRQRETEPFLHFAMEIELQYLKLHRDTQTLDSHSILQFIAERSLPYLKPHLLGCSAKNLYELIRLAQKIEPLPQSPPSPNRNRQHSNSYQKKPNHLRDNPTNKKPENSVPFRKASPQNQHSTSKNLCIQCIQKSPSPPSSRAPRPENEINQQTAPSESTPTDEEPNLGSLSICNINLCESESLPTMPVNLPSGRNKNDRVIGTNLVDCGSDVSVLGNNRLWEGKSIEPWRFGPIKLADGTLRTPAGTLDYKFNLGGRSFTSRFALLPGCDFTMILGMNFLRNSGIIIDFATFKWWFKDQPKRIFNFNSHDVSNCSVRSLQLFSEAQKKEIKKVLSSFPTVFDAPALGSTTAGEHTITIKEDKPRLRRPFPYSEAKHAIIDKIVDDMFRRGLIDESNAPNSSPIILRPKPGGDHRLVHDYHYVNSLTVPDAFPMRKVQEMLRILSEAKYLSTIDMEKGFWKVPLTKSDRHLTAFQTRKGLFQYRVMPQGLRNSPATFQRLMNKVRKGMDTFTFTYQDDTLIFSKTFEDHILHLRQVLERLQHANLTVKPDKCQFGRDKLKFLCHIISSKGIEKNPEKVLAMRSLQPPKTRRQLRKFLGAMGWFQHFIPNMAITASPLYQLLHLNRKFQWLPIHQSAF